MQAAPYHLADATRKHVCRQLHLSHAAQTSRLLSERPHYLDDKKGIAFRFTFEKIQHSRTSPVLTQHHCAQFRHTALVQSWQSDHQRPWKLIGQVGALVITVAAHDEQ